MKKVFTAVLAGLLAVSLSIPAFAGQWKRDNVGWWYQNDDSSYQQNGWFRDADGTYYYFNASGYMLADTMTPDGYYVNQSGAWVPGTQGSAASGRDFAYANYMHMYPVLKYPTADYYNIYLGVRDAHITDLGDCYEVKNVKIYKPVEFASRAEAQKTLNSLMITDPETYDVGYIRDFGYGTYTIGGMDEITYDKLLWTGSVYVKKNAPIYYQDYGDYSSAPVDRTISFAQYLQEVGWKDFPFWDVVIGTIDQDGYVTSLRGANWG